MKPIVVSLALAGLLAAVGTPTLARDELDATRAEAVQLKDGSTLYLFKDGRMARENRYGRAVPTKKGEVLEAADGRRITATSNESARLNRLLMDGHRN